MTTTRKLIAITALTVAAGGTTLGVLATAPSRAVVHYVPSGWTPPTPIPTVLVPATTVPKAVFPASNTAAPVTTIQAPTTTTTTTQPYVPVVPTVPAPSPPAANPAIPQFQAPTCELWQTQAEIAPVAGWPGFYYVPTAPNAVTQMVCAWH